VAKWKALGDLTSPTSPASRTRTNASCTMSSPSPAERNCLRSHARKIALFDSTLSANQRKCSVPAEAISDYRGND